MPSHSTAEARSIVLRSRIQEDLARHVVKPGSIGDAYIRLQDVERAWSGHETIQQALYPADLSDAEVDLIRDQLLIFLSILVYIDAHEFLADFRKNILDVFDANGDHRYSNSNLPLQESDVPVVGNFVRQKRFLDEQYLFIPVGLYSPASRALGTNTR
jgi:hypothetical protein